MVTFSTSPARPIYSVGLPAMRDYRLGTATFTLLKAEVSPQTTEKNALQIRLRMLNDNRFDANFWDRSFRLIVNGVPMAPESNLNEVVPAQSAKEGDVIFVVPRGTTGGNLKITKPIGIASERALVGVECGVQAAHIGDVRRIRRGSDSPAAEVAVRDCCHDHNYDHQRNALQPFPNCRHIRPAGISKRS